MVPSSTSTSRVRSRLPPPSSLATASRAEALKVDVADVVSVDGAADRVRGDPRRLRRSLSRTWACSSSARSRNLTDDDWEWVLGVNVLGTVRTVRAFLPLLRARSGWRRIVLTASSSVLAPTKRIGAYQTTKFAVMGFGETFREELRDEDIGVTVLFPGGMVTRHLESRVRARVPARYSKSTEARDDDLDPKCSLIVPWQRVMSRCLKTRSGTCSPTSTQTIRTSSPTAFPVPCTTQRRDAMDDTLSTAWRTS